MQIKANCDIYYDDIVRVLSGPLEGRVGVVDDEESGNAIVHFGGYFLTPQYYLIDPDNLKHCSVDDYLKREAEIVTALFTNHDRSWKHRYELLAELELIRGELAAGLNPTDMWFDKKTRRKITKVFLAHSANDKPIARAIRLDLLNRGFDVWIDEQEIFAGESIPVKISRAIAESHFMVVLLSGASVASKWVEKEWATKIIQEIPAGRVSIIPALLEPCAIPAVLRDKRYADFTESYGDGLRELVKGLARPRATKR